MIHYYDASWIPLKERIENELIAAKDKLIVDTAAELKVQNPADITKRATQLQGEIASMKREIEALNSKLAGSKLADVLSGNPPLREYLPRKYSERFLWGHKHRALRSALSLHPDGLPKSRNLAGCHRA